MKNISPLQPEIDLVLEDYLKGYGLTDLPTPAVNMIEDLDKTIVKQGKTIDLGDIAPNFTLPDENNNSITLSDILLEGPIILSFFRGDWCPICDVELRALQRYLLDFQKYNATLLAISPQKLYYSKLSKTKRNLEYAVLSDIGNNVANLYGLGFEMPDDMKTLYEALQIDLPDFNGTEKHELSIPATYVINKKRKIVFAFVDADYTKRSEPADILAALMNL